MKGNKIDSFDELNDPAKLRKYIDWEFSNLRACSSSENQRKRMILIFENILNLFIGKIEETITFEDNELVAFNKERYERFFCRDKIGGLKIASIKEVNKVK